MREGGCGICYCLELTGTPKASYILHAFDLQVLGSGSTGVDRYIGAAGLTLTHKLTKKPTA